MTHYVFKTPGKLELEAFTVMGLSAKDTNNPIGFFGTGLKYAIAIIKRFGGSVRIKTDEYECVIGSEAGTFRGQEYTKLMCDFLGEDGTVASSMTLPYTTDYGKTWNPWMAFRELWSNTIDEGGEWYEHSDFDTSTCFTDNTYIVVECHEFAEVVLNFNDRFIDDGRWSAMQRAGIVINADFKLGKVAVIYGGTGKVFWRGVYIGRMEGLAFDIVVCENQKLKIGEDRMADYWVLHSHIVAGLASLIPKTNNEKLVRAYASASDGTPNSFLEMVATDPTTFDVANNGAMYRRIGNELFDLHHKIPNKHFAQMVRSHRLLDFYEDDVTADDAAQVRERVDKAIEYLTGMNILFRNTSVVLSETLPKNILGMVRDGAIYVSVNYARECTDQALYELLYEEFIHLVANVDDFTREMQNRLIGDAIKMYKRAYEAEEALLKRGEEALKDIEYDTPF